jgi:hypothetical protein
MLFQWPCGFCNHGSKGKELWQTNQNVISSTEALLKIATFSRKITLIAAFSIKKKLKNITALSTSTTKKLVIHVSMFMLEQVLILWCIGTDFFRPQDFSDVFFLILKILLIKNRIQSRARGMETGVERSYIEDLQKLYEGNLLAQINKSEINLVTIESDFMEEVAVADKVYDDVYATKRNFA